MLNMKALLFLSLVLAFASCKPGQGDTTGNTKKIPDEANLVEIQLLVEGMTCTGCEESIESGVLALDGTSEAIADFRTGNTIIKADTSMVSIVKLRESIENKGYHVKDAFISMQADTSLHQ